ncbi:hypothetical protein [Parachlamydia acanthamoebae]|uniref:hypothetical protein n=3 Tax=Parachlamydia acanthamoebae TaxID=83552 RepID=UPI000AB19D3C|nr:hypothetical protein [Parachlamydia acanthamoebae]
MVAKKMKTLHRHELDFERTMEFVKDNLNEVNALSSELLNLVDFKSGVFFTLLTVDSNLERLYEFENGIILPQNPIIVSETNGKKSRHQRVPTIKEELSDFIFHKLSLSNKLSCIFDEVTRSPDESNLKAFYEKKSVYLYENEVMYVIRELNKNHEFILKCVGKSFSFWHSVGVLTEADCFKNDSNILSLEDIQAICKKTKMMFISAYDGEAYVLWEKIE